MRNGEECGRLGGEGKRSSMLCRQNSATGTRTRVARVRAEYPNQLDYSGFCFRLKFGSLLCGKNEKLTWVDVSL